MTDTDTATPPQTAEAAEAAFVPHLAAGLALLSPAELKRLDAAITPDAAFLLTKAFGPAMGALLWPLVVDDAPAAKPPEPRTVP